MDKWTDHKLHNNEHALYKMTTSHTLRNDKHTLYNCTKCGAHTLTDKRRAHDNGHHLQSAAPTINIKKGKCSASTCEIPEAKNIINYSMS